MYFLRFTCEGVFTGLVFGTLWIICQFQLNFNSIIRYHPLFLLMKTCASVMLVVLINADSMLIWCVEQLLQMGTTLDACQKRQCALFGFISIRLSLNHVNQVWSPSLNSLKSLHLLQYHPQRKWSSNVTKCCACHVKSALPYLDRNLLVSEIF